MPGVVNLVPNNRSALPEILSLPLIPRLPIIQVKKSTLSTGIGITLRSDSAWRKEL
jgi:hypothetical protein